MMPWRWKPQARSCWCWSACRLSWQNASPALSIPVIGIGAGNVTDGQILVMHDAFGITGGHIPKFAKNFLTEAGDMRAAVRQYIADVESGVYPGEEHSFH
jgi:3-methyl-2-oxobutanoate hydroxymethyltransferase